MMSKEQFGLYSVGFATVLLLSGLISASIGMQFTVNLPDQENHCRAQYAVHHAAAVALVCFGMIGIAVAFSFLPREIGGFDAYLVSELAVPVTVAVTFYSLRDLLIRLAYSERRETAVLKSNMVVGFFNLGALFSISRLLSAAPSAEIALYVYAVGQMVGCLSGVSLGALPWHGICWTQVSGAFAESWKGGRWAVISSLAYNVRTQAHSFLIPPLLGVRVLAEINAARILVTPAVMAIPPFSDVLMPRLAERRQQGLLKLARASSIAIGGLSAVTLLYSSALMLSLNWLLPLIFGETYRNIDQLVFGWCAVTVFLALRNGLSLALQVVRAFRGLMLANVFAALWTLILFRPFVEHFGVLGAIYAIAAVEMLLCVVLLLMLFFLMRVTAKEPLI